ncbi:winged helix DNA-binding domain-containing protein [Citricoccus nitrophenolicus]|uniref:Winged helix DNA-binding domain-containing protein n=1 Tax=Citricoccus nitrophenolicus TaxID=863575 RepID=A0ABV0IKV7_9MICC
MQTLTPERVARMRLLSQGLTDPWPGPVEAARSLVCTQGQDYPGSTVSLALRSGTAAGSGRSAGRHGAGTTAAVRQAYDAGLIVRSWPMRGTLFVVASEDLAWILDLTAPRMLTSTDRRRVELGLDTATLAAAESTAVRELSGAGHTRAALLEAWTREGLPVQDGRGYHLIFFLALTGVLCFGPTEGNGQRIVLVEEWIGRHGPSTSTPAARTRDQGVRELLLRYLRSHGPATLEDFCWWSKLGKTEARAALREIRGEAPDQLEGADVGGREHWMAAGLPDRYADRARATAAPLLLPGFDEIVLGYQDRSAVLTKAEEARVVPGGNGVFKGTVLHRGHAVGTWKRSTRKGRPVEVEPFGTLPAPVETAMPRLSAGLPG